MAVGGYLWLAYRDKKLKAKNQGFTEPNESSVAASEEQDSMNVILAILPLIVVVVTLNVLKWEPIVSLLIGIFSILLINFKHYKTFISSINEGVRGQLDGLAKTRNVPLESVLEEVIYPLVPQKRLLDVSEIADYAIFLASDKAKGVTGQAVVMDGGYTAQ